MICVPDRRKLWLKELLLFFFLKTVASHETMAEVKIGKKLANRINRTKKKNRIQNQLQ